MIDERPLTGVFETRFDPTHFAASEARGHLRSYLDDNGIEPALADDLELTAAELFSNAVEQHPADPVEVELSFDGATIYLTVTNHHPDGSAAGLPIDPVDGGAEPLAERGRGLAIVEALADGMWLNVGRSSTSVICLHHRRR